MSNDNPGKKIADIALATALPLLCAPEPCPIHPSGHREPQQPYRARSFWSPDRKHLVTVISASGELSLVDDNGFIWEPSGLERELAEIDRAAE